LEYVVAVKAVSAACFAPGDRWQIEHPDGMSLRFTTLYKAGAPRWLVGWLVGEAASIDEAGALYADTVHAPWQILSVSANAAIADPHTLVVYEPIPEASRYMIQGTGEPGEPPVASRAINLQRTSELFEALDAHPRFERLRRAMEHYAGALRLTSPGSAIFAANSLFIAVETLTKVIVERLCRSAGLGDDDVDALARSRGFTPVDERDRSHISRAIGDIRRTEIFEGDAKTHRALKEASDGYEHGYSDFEKLRDLAYQAFDASAGYVRRAILRETGLSQDAIADLTSGQYERPLHLWPPRLFVAGVLKATAEELDPTERPFILEAVAEVTGEAFDPAEAATEAVVNLRVRGETHSVESCSGRLGAPRLASYPRRKSAITGAPSPRAGAPPR
jgi:hypothetical protein